MDATITGSKFERIQGTQNILLNIPITKEKTVILQ